MLLPCVLAFSLALQWFLYSSLWLRWVLHIIVVHTDIHVVSPIIMAISAITLSYTHTNTQMVILYREPKRDNKFASVDTTQQSSNSTAALAFSNSSNIEALKRRVAELESILSQLQVSGHDRIIRWHKVQERLGHTLLLLPHNMLTALSHEIIKVCLFHTPSTTTTDQMFTSLYAYVAYTDAESKTFPAFLSDSWSC